MSDDKWISVYMQVPKDQQRVDCRRSGEAGYAGNVIYDAKSATFRTYRDDGNRLEIIIWKCDEWRVKNDGG